MSVMSVSDEYYYHIERRFRTYLNEQQNKRKLHMYWLRWLLSSGFNKIKTIGDCSGLPGYRYIFCVVYAH